VAERRPELEIVGEHRALDALFATARESFRQEGNALVRALARLEEAMEVHFAQEEELYYPALWSVRPAHRGELEACVTKHPDFRGRLRDVQDRASRGETSGAHLVFEAMVEDFRRHEVHEEQVLRELEAERAGAS
jgi:hemerythrin